MLLDLVEKIVLFEVGKRAFRSIPILRCEIIGQVRIVKYESVSCVNLIDGDCQIVIAKLLCLAFRVKAGIAVGKNERVGAFTDGFYRWLA